MVVILAVIFLPELLRPATQRRARVVEMEIPEPPIHTFEPLAPVPLVEQPSPRAAARVPPEPVMAEPVKAQSVPVIAEPAEETPAATAPPQPKVSASGDGNSPPAELRSWVVQVGSFSQKPNAVTLRDRLREAGFTTFMEPAEIQGRTLYRVRVGPELERSEAERLKNRLGVELQLNGQLTRYP